MTKIINRAAELGISSAQLAQEYGDAFLEDSRRFGTEADVHPKATEHIPEMIALIQTLLDKGVAYVVEGSVYYRVNRFAEYGKLSHRKPEDLLAGARVEIDERKEDPRDFDMWKAAKPGEPSWDSPWGRGRPGWHIECSAMAMKHLGETLDIHVAGEDLQFPHNENEIAQSEMATCKTFARYWVHVAFLQIDGTRMGKSEQNFILLRDALDSYPTEVIRHFLISAHYRHPLDYNRESLVKSEGAFRRLSNCLDALKKYDGQFEVEETTTSSLQHAVQAMKSQFTAAMDADFNTAQALGAIFTLVSEVNRSLSAANETPPFVFAEAHRALAEVCQVLGVYDPDAQRTDGDNVEQRDHLINLLLEIRQDARSRKDWDTSDKIRDRLKLLNIEIQDTRDGATWKIVS